MYQQTESSLQLIQPVSNLQQIMSKIHDMICVVSWINLSLSTLSENAEVPEEIYLANDFYIHMKRNV